jgi:Protein of unknown function (DUF3592).
MESYTQFLVPFLFGFLFVAVGCGLWWSGKRKKRRCTAEVTGVVKSNVPDRGSKGGTVYAPTYAYTVKGVDYVHKSNFSSKKCRFSVGQEITILYDPANPDRYYVPEEGTNVVFIAIFIALGAVAMFGPPLSLLTQ